MIIDDDANAVHSEHHKVVKHKNYDFDGLDNIDWTQIPDDLCPEKVILSKRNKERRGTWKKRQIETFYEIITRLLPGHDPESGTESNDKSDSKSDGKSGGKS